MSVFYDLSKTPRNILNQAIVRAIVSENGGALFDPSDLSTLYQDAAGTTPVTAVEQPVGKMLDKSGNGYHATQSITASRPVLSARYNLLTKTENFSDAAWTKVGINLSQALGPNGVTGAYKITEDLTAGTHRLSQAVSSSASSYIVYIKNDGANYCAVSWRGNTDIRYDVVRYNLLTKSKIIVQNTSGLYVSDSIVDIGDGWLKITITLTSAAQFHVACANQTKDPSYLVTYTGDGVSGLIVYHPQVSPSVTTPYQRVNTATDYDTDERYFPKYLRLDGVDDSMVYDSPYASSNNPSTHIIGVASRSFSANLGFLTINPTSTTIYTQRSISINSASTVKADCRNSPVAISGTVDIASIHVFSASFGGTKRAAISVDGGAYTTAISGTPNTTSTDTAIGKGLTNVSTAFNFYGSISVGADLTEHQRHLCESYLGRKSGVQL